MAPKSDQSGEEGYSLVSGQDGTIATARPANFTSAGKGLVTLGVAAVVGGAIAAGVILRSKDQPGATSTGPEQIMLSSAWNGADWSHAMYVTWVLPYGETFTGTAPSPVSPVPPFANTALPPVNPVVQWGFSPTDLGYSTPASVATYTYTTSKSSFTSPLLLNATIGCVLPTDSAASALRGAPACDGELTPGQPFWYRVGDDANGFSAVIQAQPIALPGTDNIRFAIIGDLGTTNNSVDTIQHVVDSHNMGDGLSALIICGDISYADQTQPVWDVLGRMVQPISSVIPFERQLGNHEWFDCATPVNSTNPDPYTFTSFLARFRTSAVGTTGGAVSGDASKLYYSFDSGLVHFVNVQGYCPSMKSTGTQPCVSPGTPQYNWLVADLAAVNRAVTPWVVVTFHQPFVNSNTAHAIATEGMPMKLAIEDVLYNNKVDLVLSGHVHAYERSCRVYNYTCVPDGPYYVTIGDAGNREGLADVWVDPQPAWSIYRQATYGHGELLAANSTHMLWEWHQNPDLEPMVADSFWIVKNDPGPVGPGVTGHPVFSPNRRHA
jgi:hypothetical protein